MLEHRRRINPGCFDPNNGSDVRFFLRGGDGASYSGSESNDDEEMCFGVRWLPNVSEDEHDEGAESKQSKSLMLKLDSLGELIFDFLIFLFCTQIII